MGLDPRYEVINAGRPGRKAAQALKELKPYLAQNQNLDLVFMFLGVNDLPARDPRPGEEKVAKCIKDMSAAIDEALKVVEARQVVLVAPCDVNPATMDQRNKGKGYHIASPMLKQLEVGYRELATKKGTGFLSLLDTVSPENFKDGLHPNKKGDTQIAQAILKYLDQ